MLNQHFDIPQNVGAIYLGFDGETFKNTKNCVKLDLLNTIVSGMAYPTGRLHQELRHLVLDQQKMNPVKVTRDKYGDHAENVMH